MRLFTKLLLILSVTFSLNASDKSSILILHSYSQEYEWTKKQHDSFVKTLKDSNQEFEFFTEYLDTKRLKFTKTYQESFLEYLKMKYSELSPDLIYVTDDNALTFIFSNYKKIFKTNTKIPVFFSGINNFDMQKELPKDTFVGIYELKEIKPNIELIKQFSPQTREIYLIGDDSNTYNSIKKEFESHLSEFTNLNFHYLSDEYITNVKDKLPTKPRSFVILTTIGNFKDAKDNTLLPKESIDVIRQNRNLIILSMEDAYMHRGVVGGYMTSGASQGGGAANLVLEYLQKRSLENISSIEKGSNEYFFNAKELIDSRIILSEYIARDSTLVDHNGDSIDSKKSMFLNIFTVVFIVLFFGVVALFAIERKKYKRQAKKMSRLENLKSKLYAKDQFINNLLSFDDMAYWRLDTIKDELYVSKELLSFLGIDNNIYKDDPNVLTYFIHSNDKKLFGENMSEVKKSKKSITFSHRFVTSNKAVLNVTHKIYTEYINHTASLILGIVKIEK
ncbi:ABC transporter substrate-binding protein [Sulfurimonas sp.]|uniref:ABC transporter substrate-binding protein n=1 Tax=Sulfurimonas sp. TaxID=2022749 RepID=UPI00356908AC